MNIFLGQCLRYLSDKTIARANIKGTYNIPTDLDHATKLILEQISKLGVKLVNKEGSEIIVTPEDFHQFWKQVGKFTSLLMSNYGHYKAAIQCDTSTKVLAQQLTVVTRSRVRPKS
jgi:hypothetical protein